MERTSIAWTLGAIMACVALVAGLSFLRPKPPGEAGNSEHTTREVALTCTSDMATQFHIHPSLKIVVDGSATPIPANIGIGSSCMNALHTHDASGMIHIESPEKRDFTLSDFFAVWEKPFSANEVLGYKLDATHTIRVTVNGTEVDTYENTVLKDKDQIVISYEPRI